MSNHFSADNFKFPGDDRRLDLTDVFAFTAPHDPDTTVLIIDTTTQVGGSAGGIENIPFVVQNANATSMSAIFWIEKVQREHGDGHFLQLQYTQKVILNFLGIDWPHIQVATLVKH